MPWHLTHDITEFAAAAGDYLRSDPVANTVTLTVLEALQQSGLAVYGDAAPLFGWHESGGQVDGAVLRTPPHPMVAARVPAGSAEALIRLLGGDRPPAISLPDQDAAEFGATWTDVTGGSTAVHHRMRLFRLAALEPASAPGAARMAGHGDFDLLVGWTDAFGAETNTGGGESDRAVRKYLGYGGLTVWEDDGSPVAMASLTRHVAGVCRVGSVFTPPRLRQRGYGGAVTTAVSQQALDAGATGVVLYTDLANPTSNSLYQRLGYRPVEDRVVIGFRP